MIAFLADENFDGRIVRGVRRREPAVDLVTVQESGWMGLPDPELLDRAAAARRVILTHDVQTLAGFAYDRVRSGLHMSGVLEVPKRVSIGAAIEDVIFFAVCSDEADWAGAVRYLPFRG